MKPAATGQCPLRAAGSARGRRVVNGFGEACSLLSALAWAIGVILYRQLGATLPPLQLNFLKNGLVLLMLVPAIPLLHGLAIPSFTWTQAGAAVASGLLGIGIADTLYFRALNELGAGRMGVIGNFYSPFVIVLSVAFLGEHLSPVQIAGFALVSLGVWLAAWPRRGSGDAGPTPAHRLRGVGLALLAVVLMAISIVMVKRVLEAQPLLWVTGLRMLGALVGMVVIALMRGETRHLAPPTVGMPWARLALAAFVGQFLAMVLWLAGYKFTQASVAAVLNETASVFILLLAWAWLKEPIARRALVGVGLTLAGVSCMLWVR
jgi:drug/metabolite transporter (DMT)-like permease